MKTKEISALVVLALLFGASVYNIREIDALKDGIISLLYEAEQYADNGSIEKCKDVLQAALDEFSDAEEYTHIFIRHPEIDSTADAFYELLSCVGDYNADEFKARLELLRYHLESIASMEHISFGSVM